MKRLLAALAATASMATLAAPEKAAVIRVADTAGIVSAVSKVGEFIGNPMLALPLTAGIAGNPVAKTLGPGRAGAATLLVWYVDPAEVEKAPEKIFDDDLHFALVYPVAKGKAAFLKGHPDAVEKDGAIALGAPKGTFAVFSDDDAWAVLSDDAARARAALTDIPEAQKPLAGDVAHIAVTPAGMKASAGLLGFVLAQQGEARGDDVARLVRLVGEISSMEIALRVDDAGITFRTAVGTVPGTYSARIAAKPLAEGDALAFAGRDAVYAFACAADCGQQYDLDAWWGKLAKLAEKYGIDFAGWLSCARKGAARTFTFDFDACAKYFAGPGQEKFAAIDPEAFMKDYRATFDDSSAWTKVEGPACSTAFALKGLDAGETPSARLRRLAPEAAAKKPYSVAVVSPYATLRALAPKMAAFLPEEDRASVQPLLQSLPPVGKDGVALCGWRDGETLRGVVRIAPDEVKGIAFVFTLGTSYVSIQEMKAMEMETPDEDDDKD